MIFIVIISFVFIFLMLIGFINEITLKKVIKNLPYKSLVTLHLKNGGEIVGVYYDVDDKTITTVFNEVITTTNINDIYKVTKSLITDTRMVNSYIGYSWLFEHDDRDDYDY